MTESDVRHRGNAHGHATPPRRRDLQALLQVHILGLELVKLP